MTNNPWNEISAPLQDVAARRIDHTHPLDLFWAQDALGHYLFVYEIEEPVSLPKIELPKLVGIQALYTQPNPDNTRARLILVLNEQSNWEIFLSLCNDLVQTTREAKTSTTAIQAILRRLARWQDFLKNIRNDVLSESEIKGLIGELLFMERHLIPAFGAGQSIFFWQGPEGLPQDFNVNNSAIEVKCQSGTTSPSIKISSVNQLCPQLSEMYLYVVTLGKATPDSVSSINLHLLVSRLRNALLLETSNQLERFNDLLHMIGYIDSDIYLEFSYILSDERMYEVKDGFPRICPNQVHIGIENLTYSVKLSECEQFKSCPKWMKSSL